MRQPQYFYFFIYNATLCHTFLLSGDLQLPCLPFDIVPTLFGTKLLTSHSLVQQALLTHSTLFPAYHYACHACAFFKIQMKFILFLRIIAPKFSFIALKKLYGTYDLKQTFINILTERFINLCKVFETNT